MRMQAMPALFVSHGSPMHALDAGAVAQVWRDIAARLPRPRAILMMSAHWEEAAPMLTGAANPETIHDFAGFPPPLYQIRYPAPGDPALAARAKALLDAAGIATGIDPARGLDEAVSATFRHSALRRGRYMDYFALYGEKGTLHVNGAFMQGPMFLRAGGPTWEELAIPLSVLDGLTDEEDHTQRNWNQLARDFASDLRGESSLRYLNFRDGWIYQELIDAIRSNRCWRTVAP